MVRLATASAAFGVIAIVSFPSSFAGAAVSADAVVQYAPGAAPSGYQTAAAALGELNPDTNAGTTFGFGALTPFNAPWQGSQMVGIGAGGSLTLHLAQTAAQIGIHAGVGLTDANWPNGQNTATASTYTNPRQAEVSVSNDGTIFVPLGTVLFDSPSNFYDEGVTQPSNQGEITGVKHAADFGKRFTGTLASFNGKDWPGTLGVLDGSAGGEWLDLSSALPEGANYVRLTVPSGQLDPMFVDAVAVVPVPEPSGALALTVVPMLLLGTRRRRSCTGH